MEVILEVLHPHGMRTRHRLDALPLTIGRALASDVILDDPYVDASHARISLDESGALVIEDLASVNGIHAVGGKIEGRVAVQPGAEVRVGRTTLRFRDPADPVTPALVDEPVIVVGAHHPHPGLAAARREATLPVQHSAPLIGRWIASMPGRLLLFGGAFTAVALSGWLGSTQRDSEGDVFGAAFAFAVVAALWAGGWALASRAAVHRAHFLGHLAVVSAVALAGIAWMETNEWLTFFFPDGAFLPFLALVAGAVLLAALIAWHLSLSSTLPREQQVRAGVLVAATVFTLGGFIVLVDDESFTDVATYSGVLKPIASRWVPTETVDEFSAVALELKGEVDEMVQKKK